MTEDERAGVTPSSGNVFADLGLPEPERLLAEADRARSRDRLGRLACDAWWDGEPDCVWDERLEATREDWRRAAEAVAAEVRRQDRAKVAALLVPARERLAGWRAEADSGVPRDIHLIAGGERVKALVDALATLEEDR